MRRKLFGLLSAGALIVGGSVLVLAAPASAGEPAPSVDVNISKVVHGDDPGVAFPIVLTCTSVTEEQPVLAPTTQSDINLGQNDTDVFTVHLKDGQSDTVSVQLPQSPPDSVTCEVTEDVSDANLPTGWECDDNPDISPSHFTLFDSEEENFQIPDEVNVTVENDCTAPATTTTTTTTTLAPKPPAPPAPAPKPVVAAARFTG